MIQQTANSIPSAKSLILAISGPDAVKFLQGQLTCDVAALTDGQSTLGAYCNIKGKVISLFTLHRVGNDYQLHTQADLLDPTIQELKKYAVFSKVKLETAEIDQEPKDDYQEILQKIPALYPQTIGEFFPHDLNLPQLGAVSFTKGCYRGQEIVARMQHRGNLKRSLYIFNMPIIDIHPGDIISSNDSNQAGKIVRFCTHADQLFGLAVLTDTIACTQLFLAKTKLQLQKV